MKDEQILKKAIEKAVKNGWKGGKGYLELMKVNAMGVDTGSSVNDVIFSHSFAKAFWGEELANCDKCGAGNVRICNCIDAGVVHRWKYNLQQMVLAEQPLKYIAKFLK